MILRISLLGVGLQAPDPPAEIEAAGGRTEITLSASSKWSCNPHARARGSEIPMVDGHRCSLEELRHPAVAKQNYADEGESCSTHLQHQHTTYWGMTTSSTTL